MHSNNIQLDTVNVKDEATNADNESTDADMASTVSHGDPGSGTAVLIHRKPWKQALCIQPSQMLL
jgi:hypothetical protein